MNQRSVHLGLKIKFDQGCFLRVSSQERCSVELHSHVARDTHAGQVKSHQMRTGSVSGYELRWAFIERLKTFACLSDSLRIKTLRNSFVTWLVIWPSNCYRQWRPNTESTDNDLDDHVSSWCPHLRFSKWSCSCFRLAFSTMEKQALSLEKRLSADRRTRISLHWCAWVYNFLILSSSPVPDDRAVWYKSSNTTAQWKQTSLLAERLTCTCARISKNCLGGMERRSTISRWEKQWRHPSVTDLRWITLWNWCVCPTPFESVPDSTECTRCTQAWFASRAETVEKDVHESIRTSFSIALTIWVVRMPGWRSRSQRSSMVRTTVLWWSSNWWTKSCI